MNHYKVKLELKKLSEHYTDKNKICNLSIGLFSPPINMKRKSIPVIKNGVEKPIKKQTCQPRSETFGIRIGKEYQVEVSKEPDYSSIDREDTLILFSRSDYKQD